MGVRKLAITADDYGPHPFINKGILHAVENNLITAVSVFCNEYSKKGETENEYDLKKEVETLIDAINNRKDKETIKEIGIGVHLTLTSGNPIVKDRGLIHYKTVNGKVMTRFQDANEFVFTAGLKHLKLIQEEIESQIRALKKILDPHGIPVDHVSCHLGLIPLWGVYNDCLIRALNNIYNPSEYSVNQKPTIRNPLTVGRRKYWKKRFPKSRMVAEGFRRARFMIGDNKRRFLKLLWNISNSKVEKRINKYKYNRFNVPDLFFDNYYKKPGLHELRKVFKYLPAKNKNQTGELVVHLGDLEGADKDVVYHGIENDYFDGRTKELEILKQFNLHELAQEKGVELVCMREIYNH